MRIEYNLKDVFSNEFNSDHQGVLYAIKNLLDGRFYIGQTTYLINRFRDNKLWSHKIKESYIDNPIRFHGPENFIVIIIKEGLSKDELDYYEELYIKRLHTYCYDEWWLSHDGPKQYNQDPGGHSLNKMKGMLHKSMQSRIELGNGDPAYMMHNEECYSKSANTRRLLYGSANSKCNTPEARAKADATDRLNHGGRKAWNSREQVIAMVATQRANHKGMLAFHTELARSKSKESNSINGIVNICNQILKHTDILSIETYNKYKNRYQQPSSDRLKELLEMYKGDERLSILNKFKSIILD